MENSRKPKSVETIKAIETWYNGIKYRSRTEARWAVFFDACNIKHTWEKQGYELPSGRYLCDFYLEGTDWSCWLEVKGTEPTDEEFQKGYELSIATDRCVMFGVDFPGEKMYGFLNVAKNETELFDCFTWTTELEIRSWKKRIVGPGTNCVINGIINGPKTDCAHRDFILKLLQEKPEMIQTAMIAIKEINENNSGFLDLANSNFMLYSGEIQKPMWAINAARSARFEFGESG